MKANLEASGGLVLAEAVSFALAEKLGRSEAHELVAELTREAAKAKRTFKDVVTDSPKIKPHLSANELERLFMPNHYQGSAQTFIDRLVASSQGRGIRRSSSVARLTDPKLPTARAEHLANLRAATQAAKAPVAAQPIAASVPEPTIETPAPAVEPPAAAVSPVEPVAETTPKVEDAVAHSSERLGQAVEAASALIAQTISELARPSGLSSVAPPAIEPPAAEPVADAEPDAAEEPVVAEIEPDTAASIDPEPASSEAAMPDAEETAPTVEPVVVAETVAETQVTAEAIPEITAAATEHAAVEVASNQAASIAEQPDTEPRAEEDKPGALLDLFARAAENENAPPVEPRRERKPA
jgi:hypothetical protein